MKAKSKAQYINEWGNHINQLIHPFLDADAPINEWEEAKSDLMVVVNKAASSLFPEKEAA